MLDDDRINDIARRVCREHGHDVMLPVSVVREPKVWKVMAATGRAAPFVYIELDPETGDVVTSRVL